MSLLQFCTTEHQRNVITLHLEGLGYQKIADRLGITKWGARDVVKNIKSKAAIQGHSPSHDMIHIVPEGYTVKGVSTYYNDEGKPVGQWVKSQSDKEHALRVALDHFKAGLKDELKGLAKPIKKSKAQKHKDRMAVTIVGDHHLGMLAWSPETGADPWDLQIAQDTLIKGVDKLVASTGDCAVGVLLNVGDMIHANNLKGETGAGTPLDVDGRAGKTIRAAGNLFQIIVTRMLQQYDEVWLINARGNHDPDAALWLNEMLRMYYEKEKRVKVFDNFNKFIHFEWGNNFVVTHHGDKIRTRQLYEAITRDYPQEWGRTKYRFAWTGHIHHKQAEELGGLTWESWSVLPPPDAWHSASGYGSQRSISCVVLDKEHGEFSRFKVGIEALQ
jgi:hypothetical protein